MPTTSISINLIVIRSPDLARAAVFYEALGIRFERERHGTGPEHLAGDVTGTILEIYPLGQSQAPTTSVRLGFCVDDVDARIADLIAIGAEIVKMPSTNKWGRRAIVRDVDGHTIELVTPSDRVS